MGINMSLKCWLGFHKWILIRTEGWLGSVRYYKCAKCQTEEMVEDPERWDS